MNHFIRHTQTPPRDRRDLANLQRMFPFIWEYRGRVLFALSCARSAIP